MSKPISLAIETSCRAGGAAVGRGDDLLAVAAFDAAQRHATQLVARLAALLGEAGLSPGDLDEVYVSAGPGSFTGLRIGITVARTMAQTLPRLRCVAVPTIQAVAANAKDLDCDRLGVLMDAKEDQVYAGLFIRQGGVLVPAGEPGLVAVGEFLSACPRLTTLIGEALRFIAIQAEGLIRGPEAMDMPTPEHVWRVGRRMASEGSFVDYHRLLPVYSRRPEAVRLWERKKA